MGLRAGDSASLRTLACGMLLPSETMLQMRRQCGSAAVLQNLPLS